MSSPLPEIPDPGADAPWPDRMRYIEAVTAQALVRAQERLAAAHEASRLVMLDQVQTGQAMVAAVQTPSPTAPGHAEREVLAALLAEVQADPQAVAQAVLNRLQAVDSMLGG